MSTQLSKDLKKRKSEGVSRVARRSGTKSRTARLALKRERALRKKNRNK